MEDIKRMLPNDTVLDLEVIRTLPDDGANNGQRSKARYPSKSICTTSTK
ncbi:hypothetical protein [Candidatus Cardinium hertigii]|nr:hypothetical protein [Candidatus Cardinium hertigii]